MAILPPLPVDLYLLQEFQAMDADNRGYLNCKEFANLMLYLGFYQPIEIFRKKLLEVVSDEDPLISQSEYIRLMIGDQEFLDGTRLLRDLFKKFDRDNSGYALKKDVIIDLKDMGIYSDSMGSKIDAMDSNNNGSISYKDFLKIYFQGK